MNKYIETGGRFRPDFVPYITTNLHFDFLVFKIILLIVFLLNMSLNLLFVHHLAIRPFKCFCVFFVAGQSLGEEADGAGRMSLFLVFVAAFSFDLEARGSAMLRA